MKTPFLYPILAQIAAAVSLLIIVISFVLTGIFGANTAACELYFVAHQTDSLQAGQTEVQLQGGAGYILPSQGLAFGVYFERDEAESVLEKVKKSYPTAYIYTAVMNEPTNDERAFFQALQCVCELDHRLVEGMTQTQAKSVLEELSKWFSYFSRQGTGEVYTAAEQLSLRLRELTAGIVYVNDLRYVACEGAMASIRA